MRAIKTTTISILAVGLLVGSAVGVAAQEEEASASAPAEFEARWAFGPEIRTETSEAMDGFTRYVGGAWRPVVLIAATDPRFRGTLSTAANNNDYGALGGPTVFNYAFRVVNDEGAWQQRPTLSLNFPDADTTTGLAVFDGEGGYEGLTALVQNTVNPQAGQWTLRGYIFDGELPPAAESPTE